ncbi:hypothetical protein NT6N_02900 [Oceaniferula spumae]|uniref:Uncharacterized protein n=1 Tax=Oceaniferula spumae TaxID=2979115 RepID=A0AAT9FGY8_9BACT
MELSQPLSGAVTPIHHPDPCHHHITHSYLTIIALLTNPTIEKSPHNAQ